MVVHSQSGKYRESAVAFRCSKGSHLSEAEDTPWVLQEWWLQVRTAGAVSQLFVEETRRLWSYEYLITSGISADLDVKFLQAFKAFSFYSEFFKINNHTIGRDSLPGPCSVVAQRVRLQSTCPESHRPSGSSKGPRSKHQGESTGFSAAWGSVCFLLERTLDSWSGFSPATQTTARASIHVVSPKLALLTYHHGTLSNKNLWVPCVPWVTNSLISDPGISCLLRLSMKWWLANLLVCKHSKILELHSAKPFVYLMLEIPQ